MSSEIVDLKRIDTNMISLDHSPKKRALTMTAAHVVGPSDTKEVK
jgi:hypothetical protein